MAKTDKKVAAGKKTDQMDRLFEEFFVLTREAMGALESGFELKGVVEQVLGTGNEDAQKVKLRSSHPWATLVRLRDYAVNGIEAKGYDTDAIVIDGAQVLKLVTSENFWPSEEWNHLVKMADGRYGLDDGQSVELSTLALMANVDVRTVRNAISAGALESRKTGDSVYIENESARRWLLGRKGFKPTVSSTDAERRSLEQVCTPGEFAAFLAAQRARIGLSGETDKLVVFHPSVNADSVKELESGLFTLPLDTVFPLAAYYQVDRKKFLDCVMRVFFSDELRALNADRGEGGE
ncbi:hypothetical protein PQR08_29740 [Caballeronia jiangsuensis]|uniref:Uncharacterized protein n=1 Tax=Caballeronia jiangsuensis TaxID=1458357 RepID=A0ABW9CVH7_9BURK